MHLLSFQTLAQLPCGFHLPASVLPKDVMTKHSHAGHPSITIKSLSRRVLLQLMGFSPVSLCINPVFAAPMLEMQEPEVIRTLKLPSGVRIQEIIEGEGPETRDGDYVQLNYVCRRSNGYFVHSTVDQFSGESSPVTLPLDENQIIKGLKDVLTGMKVGGTNSEAMHSHNSDICSTDSFFRFLHICKIHSPDRSGKRRALVPPSVGYINENLQPIPNEFGPRRSLLSHAKEPLIFEVQLLKIL